MRSGLTTFRRWLTHRRTALLATVGLGGLAAAAWTWLGLSAGLAASGASLLIIEALGERR